MSLLVVPNTFTNGTGPANIIDATQMNANFTAVATAVNNIYPSQILPITTAQATFGATATGVGYKFLANDATATPLTVSGVSAMTADLFDITLTSGGTRALSVIANGSLSLGPATNASASNGDLTVARTASTGALFFGSNATTFLLLSASQLGLTGASFVAGTIIASTLIDCGTSGSTSSGTVQIGGATPASGWTRFLTSGSAVNTIVGNILSVADTGTVYTTVDGSGNLGVLGTVHATSRRDRKQRIEYVDPTEALEVVLSTKIARYDFITEEPQENGQSRHASFIADEAPWQLSGGPGYEHADAQKTASYALAAIAALHAKVIALEGKLPTA